MDLNANIELVDSIPQITKVLMGEWVRLLNAAARAAKPKIESRVKELIITLLPRTETYKSLMNGALQAHFGLTSNEVGGKLDDITKLIADSVKVIATPFKYNRTITGGLEISAFYADFAYLTKSDAGHVTTKKGQPLPWLDWLLLQGDRIIITDYVIHFVSHPDSRSGQAFMVESTSGFWRVPPEFSGTAANNWITRMLEEDSTLIEDALADIVIGEIENVL